MLIRRSVSLEACMATTKLRIPADLTTLRISQVRDTTIRLVAMLATSAAELRAPMAQDFASSQWALLKADRRGQTDRRDKRDRTTDGDRRDVHHNNVTAIIT
jgi:hypothetical protein